METVRGRWFLAEYARRARGEEIRQVLDAVARLEHVVTEQKSEQRAMPADPSIRLLMQRLKEVTQHLDGLAGDMRAQGYDEALCGQIEAQARAVSGVLRLNGPVPSGAARLPVSPRALPRAPEAAEKIAASAPPLPAASETDRKVPQDQRLAALAAVDALPMAEKLALFS
jgi:hypothetical protein